MKREFHELSDGEKSDVADELMLAPGVFGALLIAGFMCLALVWHPHGLFDRTATPPAASLASFDATPSTTAMRISDRQAVRPE